MRFFKRLLRGVGILLIALLFAAIPWVGAFLLGAAGVEISISKSAIENIMTGFVIVSLILFVTGMILGRRWFRKS